MFFVALKAQPDLEAEQFSFSFRLSYHAGNNQISVTRRL